MDTSSCVIAIMGPTASGKTDAAAALSEQINGEIISVDSSLVYAGIDIGTAKPDVAFLEQYPHHLVDIRSPTQHYSVADFYHDAMPLIERIIAKGKIPILVGGTMFYFKALEKGLVQQPAQDAHVRDTISQEAEQKGWPAMHEKLRALDFRRASEIDSNDAQRIQRALEIITISGEKVQTLDAVQHPPLKYPLVKLILAFSDRSFLHQRIEQRFDCMLEAGLQHEVELLLQQGVNEEFASMKMIGYRQMLMYLRGKIDYQQMRNQGIAATRQLAKRQYTWLRNEVNAIWWVDFGLREKKYDILCKFLKQFACVSEYN